MRFFTPFRMTSEPISPHKNPQEPIRTQKNPKEPTSPHLCALPKFPNLLNLPKIRANLCALPNLLNLLNLPKVCAYPPLATLSFCA